ncbi:MAG TPA: class E sortase [Acidimicrobiales bacterium]
MKPSAGPPGAEAPADGPADVDAPEKLPPRRPPLGPWRRTIGEAGYTLITAGVVVLLFVGYQLWGTGFAERRSQNRLEKDFNAQIAAAPTTTPQDTASAPTTVPASSPTGEAIAHLQIPSIAVDKFVVDGTSITQLRKGPGHYTGTPLPGEPGNAAIAGHRTTYGAPFYRLNELKAGDDIFVTTTAGRFRYVVDTSSVVAPSDVSVLKPTTDNRLTLTTCNPRFSAATRLVVVSHLATTPTPAAAPAATTKPPVAVVAPVVPITLGTGDRRAWPPTILFAAIALVVWLGARIAAAHARRGGWLFILAGIGVCLVPLWFAFENVIRLLPANI